MGTSIQAEPKLSGNKLTDGSAASTVRMDDYANQWARQADSQSGLAYGRRLYVCTNPTVGTGIAAHAAATATDDSKPFLTLKNNNAAATNIRIMPLRLIVVCTAAGTNGTNLTYTMHKSAAGVSRYTSGGTANTQSGGTLLCQPMNVNSTATSAVIYAGAVVAPTDSAKVRIADNLLRAQINVVGDRYAFTFGAASFTPTPVIPASTNVVYTHDDVPAVVLEPQETFTFAFIAASQSAAPSYSFRLEYAEL